MQEVATIGLMLLPNGEPGVRFNGTHEFGEVPTEADWSDDELDDWDDDDEEDDADGTETFFRVADEAVAPVDEPKED